MIDWHPVRRTKYVVNQYITPGLFADDAFDQTSDCVVICMIASNSDTQAAHTTAVEWIPLADGAWYKPVRFNADGQGWVSLVRLAPGAKVPQHRHAGAVQGFNLQGKGRFIECDVVTTPGTYTYEPEGVIDTLVVEGDEELIMLFVVDGPVEYLAENGDVARRETYVTKKGSYDQFCADKPESKSALVV